MHQFPGSFLPFGHEQIVAAAEPHFRLVSAVSGRLDYIETIKQWRRRFAEPSLRKTLLKARLVPRYLTSRGLPPRVHLRRQRQQRLLRARAARPLPAGVRDAPDCPIGAKPGILPGMQAARRTARARAELPSEATSIKRARDAVAELAERAGAPVRRRQAGGLARRSRTPSSTVTATARSARSPSRRGSSAASWSSWSQTTGTGMRPNIDSPGPRARDLADHALASDVRFDSPPRRSDRVDELRRAGADEDAAPGELAGLDRAAVTACVVVRPRRGRPRQRRGALRAALRKPARAGPSSST